MNIATESRLVSTWTFLCTLFLISLLSFTGSNVFTICLGVAVISVIFYIFNTCAIAFWFKENPIHLLILYSKQNFSFFNFFILTIFEEIIARWLCVGILPQHLPVEYFYPLLIFGNIGFLLFKSRNFSNHPQHFLRLLPDFFAGFFFAFVFLNYGLVAVILTHLGVKSVIITLHKIEDDDEKDLIRGFANLFVACVGGLYLIYISQKTITPNFFLTEEKSFWDYFATSLILIYGFRSILFFFNYDQGTVRSDGKYYNPDILIYWLFLGFFSTVVLALIVYELLGFLMPELQIILVTLILCAFCMPNSGSGRVRNFWTTLIIVFVSFSVMNAVEWYWSLVYIVLHGLIQVLFQVSERIINAKSNS